MARKGSGRTFADGARGWGLTFDPLSLKPEATRDYSYEGPGDHLHFLGETRPLPSDRLRPPHPDHDHARCRGEEINCQVVATTLAANAGRGSTSNDTDARMAPDVPLCVCSPDEAPYAMLTAEAGVTCPHCGHVARCLKLGKEKTKKSTYPSGASRMASWGAKG